MLFLRLLLQGTRHSLPGSCCRLGHPLCRLLRWGEGATLSCSLYGSALTGVTCPTALRLARPTASNPPEALTPTSLVSSFPSSRMNPSPQGSSSYSGFLEAQLCLDPTQLVKATQLRSNVHLPRWALAICTKNGILSLPEWNGLTGKQFEGGDSSCSLLLSRAHRGHLGAHKYLLLAWMNKHTNEQSLEMT